MANYLGKQAKLLYRCDEQMETRAILALPGSCDNAPLLSM